MDLAGANRHTNSLANSAHSQSLSHTLSFFLHMRNSGATDLAGANWRLQKSPIKKTMFCKRDLYAKETYNFKDPTNCSHPIGETRGQRTSRARIGG